MGIEAITERLASAGHRLGRRGVAALGAVALVLAATGLLVARTDDDGSEQPRVVDPAEVLDHDPTAPADSVVAGAPATTLSDGVLGSNGSAADGTGGATASMRPIAAPRSGSGSGSRPSTPTTLSSSPSTTRPSSSSSTTTTSAPSADQSPPSIGQVRAGGEVPDGPDQIFDGGACGPTSIGVQAFAFDWSGVRSATVYWRFEGSHGVVSGNRAMNRSDGLYRAVIGPFPAGTAPRGGSVLIDWWVEATDEAGNTGRADAPSSANDDERIQLSSCAG